MCFSLLYLFFFFKQKTAYEMRISDWSSDVCSSDLGFHTCRALHLLQLLLGAVDAPGSFRYQPPYPKPIPLPNRPGKARRADGTLDAGPLGYVHGPEDLLVDEPGRPDRQSTRLNSSYSCASHIPSSACKKTNKEQKITTQLTSPT